jgi:hypothetical protein
MTALISAMLVSREATNVRSTAETLIVGMAVGLRQRQHGLHDCSAGILALDEFGDRRGWRVVRDSLFVPAAVAIRTSTSFGCPARHGPQPPSQRG